MRSAKRHSHNQGSGLPLHTLRNFSRLALVALSGWLLWSVAAPHVGYVPGGPEPRSGLWAQDNPPPGGAGKNVQPLSADEAAAGPSVVAYRFDVPLPIAGKSVVRRIEQVLRRLPKSDSRPVLVFEFLPASGTAGEGSSFGDALDLARYLSGDSMSQVRTVAWIPRTVKGHAVLPVLACEQIILGKDAELGAAGIDEKTIDPTLRRAYTEIAERRRTLPAAVALGLLDKDLAVYKVKTPDGLRFELAEGLAALREAGSVTSEDTFFQPGEQHLLGGPLMRGERWATHLAQDRRQLAEALTLPLAALERHLVPEEGWKPLRLAIHGPIHKRGVDWILRSLDDQQQRGEFNLLVLHLNTAGGDLDESRRLAVKLAMLGQEVYTVAFVERQARGDAALIALACDELLIQPDATLGGPGEKTFTPEELSAIRKALPEIFVPLGRDWSLPLALIDPRVEVHRYRNPHSGEVRFLSAEEAGGLPDPAAWQREERPLDTGRGITGAAAQELGLARETIDNVSQLKALYQLEGELADVRPNWALAAIEWLADPRIAGVLLFVGWFALMFEMSTPGVGVPGFVSLLCFLLYFWSQFLHGTAGWLEILLFVGGLCCLAIEIFALPGFGVFGLGGGLMVIASIVLASQTFIFPANAYQLRQFPISLLMVAAGMAGGMASIYFVRRFLPDTPYFNRMLLAPPRPEEREELSRREALVTWDHLLNKLGTTTTPLVPAGKAQFGDELVDVISNGDLIAKGTTVVVEEVAGNRVVVRKVNP